MDFGDGWQNIGIIVLLIIFFIASIFLRKRKGGDAPMIVAMTLLRDIDKNQKLVQAFHFNWKARKFKTKNWQKYNDNLGFFSEELTEVLSVGFRMAEDFNERMEEAKKHKSSSYMATIQVDKLSVPLAEGREELEQWVQDNWENKDLYPKRRGLFG